MARKKEEKKKMFEKIKLQKKKLMKIAYIKPFTDKYFQHMG